MPQKEKQFSQKECEILDFLHVHGDSTRKQIQKATHESERNTERRVARLIAANLIKQVGLTNFLRAVK